MANSHGVADMAKELQATTRDLLPACIVSTTFPTVPVPPSLTLAAFATAGYVRDGVDLVYCDQPAHTVVLTGGDGNYWVALAQDSFTTYASWNRTAGTQYLWRLSATRPPDVDGLLVMSAVTVSGGNISAVSPASGVTRAEALRALSGLGTMATQHANAVAVTGGTVVNLSSLGVLQPTPAYPLDVFGNARLSNSGQNSSLGINRTPAGAGIDLFYQRVWHGITLQPSADTGPGAALVFFNNAAAGVGSIATTATATAYNTSSDARLKEAITALAGALGVVRALRPVQFRWQADGSVGHGFLAHELMVQVPEAVSGLPDEVNDDGSIRPQQVDHSRLLPWAIAGMKELLTMVESLQARVASLEEALGL